MPDKKYSKSRCKQDAFEEWIDSDFVIIMENPLKKKTVWNRDRNLVSNQCGTKTLIT
jgi:hypothetical protein